MARSARGAFDTDFFHVIVQGINKEPIFEKPQFKNYYIELVAKLKDDYDIKLLAYCVMNTHCHMLLHVPCVDKMSDFMHKVNTMYAQFYNYVGERVGYVFRDRYKSQAITDEKYLVNCILYIHYNPVKAGIVQNAMEYEQSSLRDYIFGEGRVDLDDAKLYTLVEPKDVIELTQQYSYKNDDVDWIDVKEEERTADEKADKVLEQYHCDPSGRFLDKEQGMALAREMKKRGLLEKEIAAKLGKNVQTIYRWLKE